MSFDLAAQLETVMRQEFGLPGTTTGLQGYHIFYMGASHPQHNAFRREYYSESDVNLRVMCIKLYFALPDGLIDPFDDIAQEEEDTSTEGIPNPEKLKPNSLLHHRLAGRRLKALPLIKEKAAKLFTTLRRHPNFPTFAEIQSMPAEVLANRWASIVKIDEILEDAAALGGRIPPPYDIKSVELQAMCGHILSDSIRRFVRAGDQNRTRGDAKS